MSESRKRKHAEDEEEDEINEDEAIVFPPEEEKKEVEEEKDDSEDEEDDDDDDEEESKPLLSKSRQSKHFKKSDQSDQPNQTVQPKQAKKQLSKLPIKYEDVLRSFTYLVYKGLMPTPPDRIQRQKNRPQLFQQFTSISEQRPDEANILWLRLYDRYLKWVKEKYNCEIMCMLSSFLFLISGGIQKVARDSSARNRCIDERNLTHVNTSDWTPEQLDVMRELVAFKLGNALKWTNAEDFVKDTILPAFLRDTFGRPVAENEDLGKFMTRDEFCQEFSQPFDFRGYLETVSAVMPNIAGYTINQSVFRTWGVACPKVAKSEAAKATTMPAPRPNITPAVPRTSRAAARAPPAPSHHIDYDDDEYDFEKAKTSREEFFMSAMSCFYDMTKPERLELL